MKVKLLEYTPNPEKVISMAAKLCYSPVGVDEIEENLTPEKVDKFLNMLINIGHESPIEHVNFTFAVEGISRACSHQIVRHRIASFSQQSQRYVRLGQFMYIIPPEIADIPLAKERFIKAMEEDQKAYDEIIEMLMKNYIYSYLVEENNYYSADIQQDTDFMFNIMELEHKEKIKEIEKKAIEDARYVFPNACETKMVFTMNARSLFNFFKHRCCERAQWEIRELAIAMLKEVRKAAPIIFKNIGPSCLSDNCPEGNMSCGKMIEIREKFKNL